MTLFYEADDEMPKENEQGIMDDTAHAAPRRVKRGRPILLPMTLILSIMPISPAKSALKETAGLRTMNC